MAFSVVVVGRKQTGLQCVTGWTAERSGKVVRLDISQHGQCFTLRTCAKRNTDFTAFPRCQVDPTVVPDPVTGKHKMRH